MRRHRVLAALVMTVVLALGLVGCGGSFAGGSGGQIAPAAPGGLAFGTGAGAEDANDARGWTVWALLAEDSQEARFGYKGLLPDVEVGVGLLHEDAPEPTVEDWPVRGYVIAHALSAELLGEYWGADRPLPDGELYGGLFSLYSRDRSEEWAGGYMVGGLVDWPGRWQTVAEYQEVVWNVDRAAHVFAVGLRRRF